MAVETAQAFQFVDSAMRADSQLMAAATGGVFQGYADISTIPPYAQYGRQAGTDKMTFQAIRIWTSILLQIKAVGPAANYAALVTIATRIDALFANRRNVQLSGGAILACYREQELAMDEIVNGAQWSNLGGLYRIDLQGS